MKTEENRKLSRQVLKLMIIITNIVAQWRSEEVSEPGPNFKANPPPITHYSHLC